MDVYECSFCGGKVEVGTGKMFVKKDGTILYLCSRKCEKNLLHLKRVPRRVGWTETARQARRK
jgi:large subunit ribosomal protein L24e